MLTKSFYESALRQRLSSTTTRIKTYTKHCYKQEYYNVRDYLPLQQGLRRSSLSSRVRESNVRDYLPLQQGLRHSSGRPRVLAASSQRLSSTTTRIKTGVCPCKALHM